jgi:hypothetical protein
MASRPAASEIVRREWCRRVEAEYGSAAITQNLGLWLVQIGASPDLVKMSNRIVADELEHARLSHVVYRAAGGEGLPALVRERLALRRHDTDPLEVDVARVCLDVFCLGETVAVRLFNVLRQKCTVAPARRALDRVLRDEVRHRDFGWTLLDWMLESPVAPHVRTVAERELPRFFKRVLDVYARGATDEDGDVKQLERSWGLAPPARYAEAVHKTFDRDWVPRFEARSIDAKAAWRAALAGDPD